MAIDQDEQVILSLEGPSQQRRLSVGLRAIIAIPHFFWAMVLGVVGYFAVIVAWFAALFIGRMPDGLGAFIQRVFEYYARLTGYLYLLTDDYPPFALSPAAPYAVETEVSQPDRLNRAAVLFRGILLFPATIVLSLVSAGLSVALLVIWLITLIAGRMPTSAFQAVSATLRYELRVYAYAMLLASKYPSGLFGDRAADVDVDVDVEPDELAELPTEPRITRLVLGKAAKRLIVLFIVLGVGANPASIGTANFSGSAAADQLEAQHDELEDALDEFFVAVQGCAVSGSEAEACVRDANAGLIDALREFQVELRSIDVPQGAIAYAEDVDDDVTEMIELLNQMQEASDVTAYTEAASQLGQVGAAFDRHYDQLYNAAFFG